MKKWTIMLIPHDNGERRMFELRAWQVLGGLGLVACGAVALTMYLQQQPVAHAVTRPAVIPAPLPVQVVEVVEAPVALSPPPRAFPATPSSSSSSQSAIEASVRAEYEARDAAIASELRRLYVFEAEVREAMEMPPRDDSAALVDSPDGGQGGPSLPPEVRLARISSEFAPPNLIQGVENPSADLMLHEMRIRMASMQELLAGMEVQRDRLARVPSVAPTNVAKRTITSGFGNRRDPFTKRVRFHGGIDVATDHGSPIQATARGVVVESDRDPWYGHFVRIDHGNGYETLYGHMSKRLASPGQTVERGSVIGKVGSTGRSTSPHIHYEILKDGVRVNPRKYLGR